MVVVVVVLVVETVIQLGEILEDLTEDVTGIGVRSTKCKSAGCSPGGKCCATAASADARKSFLTDSGL